MALEGVNYIALLAGVLLLSRSGYRPQLWSHGNNQAERPFEEKCRMTRRDESLSDHVLHWPDETARKGKVNRPRSKRVTAAPTDRPGSYAALVTPYGGRSYGGHYG